MSRPTNKDDLLSASDVEFSKLWELVDSMSEEQQNAMFSFEDRDRNIRDVLTHLHEWHNMVIEWHRVGVLEKGVPNVPGIGYTWKTLPLLNQEIWRMYQDTPLNEAKGLLNESHDAVTDLIMSHSNDDLFSRKVYEWTKSTTLGAYFIGCTSSHYDWAIKKIKMHRKSFK